MFCEELVSFLSVSSETWSCAVEGRGVPGWTGPEWPSGDWEWRCYGGLDFYFVFNWCGLSLVSETCNSVVYVC